MSETLEKLEAWFQERPIWMQEAAKRIAKNNAISQNDLQDFITLCKEEADIDDDVCEVNGDPIFEICSEIDESEGSLWLESISDVKGINRLNPKNPLKFGDKESPLTIIYGLNGSGKSGYVRALKHASGVKKPGKLHANVFDSSDQEQGCSFAITVDSEYKELSWVKSEGPLSYLRTLAIYDDDCVENYIDEENEVAYEPWILSLFSNLTELCNQVKIFLQKETDLKASQKPSMPKSLLETKGAIWYEKMSHRITKEEINSYCEWNDKLEKEVNTLSKRLSETNHAAKVILINRHQENLKRLHSDLRLFRDNLSDEKCSEFLLAVKDVVEKKKAADEDSKKVFENAPLEGVGSETWKLLWDHAREYSEKVAYKGLSFPNTDDEARCVLCQQVLNNEAKQRLISFKEYIKDALQKQAHESEVRLKSLTDDLENIPTENAIILLLDSASITSDPERLEIINFFSELDKRKASLFEAKDLSEVGVLPNKSILDRLMCLNASMDKQVIAIKKDEKGENREELEERRKELKARKWLSENKKSVEDEASRLIDIHLLKEAVRLTNTQPLSRKKSELTEELITVNYLKRFEDELQTLGASRLSVGIEKTRAERGCVYHQLKLKNVQMMF